MSAENTEVDKTEKTSFTCPDCAGAIERITEGPLQYRCRVGHVYTAQSALATHRERQENTLWSAMVLLEEGAEMAEESRNWTVARKAEGRCRREFFESDG